jgi:hypothetical protein
MKEIVELLADRGILCRRLERVEPRELGSRKRVEIYEGTATDDYFCMVMVLRKKSRVLQKEARELLDLHRKLEEKKEARIKRRYLLIDAPLCSRAATLLEEAGWKIFRAG